MWLSKLEALWNGNLRELEGRSCSCVLLKPFAMRAKVENEIERLQGETPTNWNEGETPVVAVRKPDRTTMW